MLRIIKTFSILAPLAAVTGCAGLTPGQANVSDMLPPPKSMAAEAELRGDWPAAARHWQAAYQAAPGERAVTLSMVRAMRLSGSCGAASAHLGRLLAKDAGDADALLESAKCNLVAGQPEAAEATL